MIIPEFNPHSDVAFYLQGNEHINWMRDHAKYVVLGKWFGYYPSSYFVSFVSVFTRFQEKGRL